MKSQYLSSVRCMLFAFMMLPVLSNGQLTVQTSYTAVSCSGGNTGSATATASGGTSPYTYSWSPGGATTSTITALTAGTYTIDVTDNVSATASAAVIVTEPAILSGGAFDIDNDPCFGSAAGIAEAFPNGGTTPYTYSWSPGGQTTAEITGLTAGTYTVTIADSCGNSETSSAIIIQPGAALSASTSFTQATCNNANGTATVTSVSGGFGATPYTYSWSDASSQTTATATGLLAGTYTVTVQDGNGCSATATASVTQPSVPIANPTSTDVTCVGGSNGTASANPSGGVSPYTYSWSDGLSQSIATATGLSTGTYTVTVTDSNGCNTTASVGITQPGILIAGTPTGSESCSGSANGSATVTPTGGTSPYTYSWSDGSSQSTATATGLSAGTYTVTVTDNCGGPSSTASVTISQAPTLTASALVNQNTSGCVNSGIATVTPGGGNSPYTYSWSDGSSQSTAIATGLSAGTYTVTITDQCSSSATATVTITQPAVLAANATSTEVTCIGGSNGTATANANGGVSPYTYSWSDGASQTTATITGLSAGTYTISVTDSNGCNTDGTVSVNEPNSLRARTPSAISSCPGNATGTATEAPLGGTTPYTYLWSDGSSQSTATATGLSEGTYTVTVTDNCGDPSVTDSVTIHQFSTPTASAHVNSNTTECLHEGSATVTPGGGSPPYTYRWSDASSQSTETASGLSGGTYTITVTDQCGNTATAVATITQPPLLEVTRYVADSTADSSIAAVITSGGVRPYTYSWSPGGATTDTITGLTDGIYTCTVTDAEHCSVTAYDTIITTGINNLASQSASIMVYPNPNNGQFTIKLSVGSGSISTGTVVEVYNVLGENIYTSALPPPNGSGSVSSAFQVNLSSRPNGVYLYRILTGNGGLVGEGKLVIQK